MHGDQESFANAAGWFQQHLPPPARISE